MSVDNPPALALFGPSGKLITLDGYELLEEQGSASYPWTVPVRDATTNAARELSMLVSNEWRNKPCVIFIAEEAKDSDKYLTALNSVAAKHTKLPFFYSFKKRISTETVRDTLNVKLNPLLCIINLKDESFRTKFVWSPPAGAAAAPITEATIEQFVADYESGKLKPFLKSAPRPPHDRYDPVVCTPACVLVVVLLTH